VPSEQDMHECFRWYKIAFSLFLGSNYFTILGGKPFLMGFHLDTTVYHMYSWLTKRHVMYTNQEAEVCSLLINQVLHAGGGCHSLSTSSGEGNSWSQPLLNRQCWLNSPGLQTSPQQPQNHVKYTKFEILTVVNIKVRIQDVMPN